MFTKEVELDDDGEQAGVMKIAYHGSLMNRMPAEFKRAEATYTEYVVAFGRYGVAEFQAGDLWDSDSAEVISSTEMSFDVSVPYTRVGRDFLFLIPKSMNSDPQFVTINYGFPESSRTNWEFNVYRVAEVFSYEIDGVKKEYFYDRDNYYNRVHEMDNQVDVLQSSYIQDRFTADSVGTAYNQYISGVTLFKRETAWSQLVGRDQQPIKLNVVVPNRDSEEFMRIAKLEITQGDATFENGERTLLVKQISEVPVIIGKQPESNAPRCRDLPDLVEHYKSYGILMGRRDIYGNIWNEKDHAVHLMWLTECSRIEVRRTDYVVRRDEVIAGHQYNSLEDYPKHDSGQPQTFSFYKAAEPCLITSLNGGVPPGTITAQGYKDEEWVDYVTLSYNAEKCMWQAGGIGDDDAPSSVEDPDSGTKDLKAFNLSFYAKHKDRVVFAAGFNVISNGYMAVKARLTPMNEDYFNGADILDVTIPTLNELMPGGQLNLLHRYKDGSTTPWRIKF